MKLSKLLFLMLWTSMSLTSCNYLSHKSIAKRHLDKVGLEICDTVTIHDTTTIEESRVDTVLSLKESHSDTVIIREGQSEVRYFYDHIRDSVYIQGVCHDTVLVKEREGQTKIVYVDKESDNLLWICLLVLSIFGVFISIYVEFKFRKNEHIKRNRAR